MAASTRWQMLDEFGLLCLARGSANALSPQFLSEIEAALASARQAAPRGLILSAEGSIFCAGLDLIHLLTLDRAGMRDVVDRLFRVGRALFALPFPVLAALNGHAIAGGAYLALCCDLRLLADGPAKFGLNESQLGLSMPAHCLEPLRYALPMPILERMLYTGQLYAAPQALALGLVDEVVEPAQLLARSAERLRAVGASPAAFADIKLRLKQPALAAMDAARASDGAWIDLWFSEAAQQRLRAARDRLRSDA